MKYYINGKVLTKQQAVEELKLKLVLLPLGWEVPLPDELFDKLYKEAKFDGKEIEGSEQTDS